MSSQGAICWPDADRFRGQWLRVLDVLREIIAIVGVKHAAYVIGIGDKALGHAMAVRERHYPRFDWLPALAALARQCGLEEKLGAALVEPLGLAICSPGISDAEFRQRVEASWDATPELAEPWRRKVYGR